MSAFKSRFLCQRVFSWQKAGCLHQKMPTIHGSIFLQDINNNNINPSLTTNARLFRGSQRALGSKSSNDKNNNKNKEATEVKTPEDLDDDAPLISSQFKNQIVHQLSTERTKAKKGGGRSSTVKPGQGKTPAESETKVEYPFSTNKILADSYMSPWGTMRMGRLLEDLDALAGNIAFYRK